MVLVDVNLPLHAVNSESPFHERARTWWDSLLSQPDPVCLAWVTVLGFVRIATNSRVFVHPMLHTEAMACIDSWLEQPCIRIIEPLPGHWDLTKELLHAAGTAGNLTTDAHLAALAIQHSCTLCSTDSDFSRFPGLQWKNPIVG